MPELQVRRLGYALGAEVRGLDLRKPLDVATVAEIRRHWLEHLVLCFPQQDLSKGELVSFSGSFGEVAPNPPNSRTADPENPYVILLTNKPIAGRPWDGYKAGQGWHSDRSFETTPTTGTFVNAKELPQVGGDTIFANQYLAYETLSPRLRATIDGLEAVHDKARTKNLKGAVNPAVVHPVVKVHPETNRKALFVRGDRVSRFVGMSEEESRPLLDFLNGHAVAYEFTYRHRWSVNDVVMWDNRCLMHVALTDYDLSQTRHLIRTSLLGPEEGRVFEDGSAAKNAVPVSVS